MWELNGNILQAVDDVGNVAETSNVAIWMRAVDPIFCYNPEDPPGRNTSMTGS